MARSALDYVRGSPTKFYEWLANAEGEFQVEIRDVDQTVIGNPAHDLIRLGLSLAERAPSVRSDLSISFTCGSIPRSSTSHPIISAGP